MKNAVIAVLLVLGVSVSGSVLACEAGGGHHKAQSGTSTQAPAPAPAPAK